MSKLNLDGLKKVKYRYHDANGDKHNICECELYEIFKKENGKTNKVPTATEKAEATITDYKAMNINSVDAHKSYFLKNGDVYTEGKKNSNIKWFLYSFILQSFK